MAKVKQIRTRKDKDSKVLSVTYIVENNERIFHIDIDKENLLSPKQQQKKFVKKKLKSFNETITTEELEEDL